MKPTPPASHQLILDRDRTGRGEKREGDKIYYKCEDPSHSINGTQETVTTSLECDAEGDYSPKDADGRPAFPVCMPRDTIQHRRNIFQQLRVVDEAFRLLYCPCKERKHQ